MKKILISGSIAYDHFLNFDGEISDSILVDRLDKINVSFIAQSHKVYFGGCAVNIAYTLKHLGDDPFVFGVGGDNFGRYEKWLEKNKISTKYIDSDEKRPTAAAYIVTDSIQNQITIFAPGAMQSRTKGIDIDKLDIAQFDLVMISPGMPHRMLLLVQKCAEKGVPYVFDPGQEVPVLPKEALLTAIENSLCTIVNAYEGELIEKKTGQKLHNLAKRVSTLIRTKGDEGCLIYSKDGEKVVPAISDIDVVDPTGAGDAFRAGFVHGLFDGFSVERSCEMGHTAASFSLTCMGTQNHHFSLGEFRERLILNYGE